MAKLTPQQIAEKQVKRSMAATQDYKDGVSSVTESPTKKAAQAVDKYAAGVQRAIDDGSYVDGCNATSLQDWQQKTLAKGGARYGQGVQAAAQSIADFQAAIAPHRDMVQRTVQAMPSLTFEDNLARMEANARGMKAFKYKKKSKA